MCRYARARVRRCVCVPCVCVGVRVCMRVSVAECVGGCACVSV